MKSAAKLAVLGIGLGLGVAGCGSGTVIVALVSPTISQVSPQVVTAGTPSVTVTVQGQNFQSNASVTLNGTAVPTTVVNATTLSAKISGSPLAQPTVAHLQVKNTNGGESNEVPLTITSASQTSSLSITTSGLAGGQTGTAYSAALSATGGTPGYTWSTASGSLPAGLTLSAGGVISGTPTASGTFTFGLTVTDAGSPAQSQTVTLSITVTVQFSPSATLTISTSGLFGAQTGTAYTAPLSANGGTPGYTWSIASGSLPAGLTLSPGGVISGTPTSSGSSTFGVTVTDTGSPAQTQTVTLSLAVIPETAGPSPLSISSAALGGGNVGSSYVAALNATGGTPVYGWSLASGNLPPGLTLSSSGVIFGTPTGSGTFNFGVTVSDSSLPVQSQTATLSIVVSPASAGPPALNIPSVALGSGQVGTSYNASLNAAGGTPNYKWSLASGSLPVGLTLSSAGVISGTPTTAGTSSFTVAVIDSGSPAQSVSSPASITVVPAGLAVRSLSLGAGLVGSSYSTSLTATGGTPSYTWSLTSGSLPAGLSLSSSGKISGTPTAAGTATFTVSVTDSASPTQTASAQESLTVAASNLSITSTSLAFGKIGSSYSTTLSGTGGTPGYSWAITSGSLPAGLTLSSGGVITGTPTASGTASFTLDLTDSGSPVQTASAQESITIAPSSLEITSTSLSSGETGMTYGATLSASGGTPGYTWTVSSGSLPAGLTLSSAGVISGTPTGTGAANFSVTATDNGTPVQTASVQESITVGSGAVTITSGNPGSGTIGIGYNVMLYASGGVPSYTWTVSSGSLPSGLTLSSAGVISGTPTSNGTSNFTIAVADSQSPAKTASAQESITINDAVQVNPPSGAQIYVYPQAPIAPRGSYQTVTAIVTGAKNTTVTWSTDGGTIVGTNPCVVNEPCTVGLYSTSTGTYHLTATSNANQQMVATSAITFTASPSPRMDHPRLLVTSDMVASLRAKANADNPMYQSIKMIATGYYNQDNSIWTFSTWNGNGCTGGSGPSSDQSPNYREIDAYWIAEVALFDPSSTTRNQFGCAARDIFMASIGYVISGEIPMTSGNRWSDSVMPFSFTADLLMGGGFLSASDEATVRQYFASFARQQMNSSIGAQAVIGNYNTPAQFDESSEWSTGDVRAMGNNYTQSRILILTAAALTFNDDPTDDPPLANTCNATRYQVCPDGTAGSLHAYWSYVSGGLLYKYWAEMEDPTVVQQAYNSAFNDLTSAPQCQASWGTPIQCLGTGRGGEANEGTFYGNSITALRRAMTAIRGAGYDDPLLYGPQMSIGTTSYWDLRYVADLSMQTGLSGAPNEHSRWNFLTHGDSLNYFVYPSSYTTDSAMLAADAVVGRTDRSNALEWLVLNAAFGMANGTAGNCQSYCGFGNEVVNDYGSATAFDLFVALPDADPTTNNAPADPRQALPTDWYDAGNQHIVTRTGGWTTGQNTIFSYYCTNTQIDHEHEFCGGFDIYSNGEYITKGRMEFNDYDDDKSAIWNKNGMMLLQYPGQNWCSSSPWCFIWQAATEGGQLWHGYQGGLDTLYHSELPGYVAAAAEDHNAYNGGWGYYGNFKGVTAASRSLMYLRGSNQVVYYDRGETGSNAWDKATYLVTTGQPAVDGNTASWLTRSGNQRAYWTTLEPSQTAPQLDTTYTDADAANDWEIYGRLKADAGNVASARFLSVLQWGSSTFAASSASRVTSTSGTSFEGALVGSSLVMFMHDWPATLTTVTYPASGATTQYISDLTPNTTYSITGAGAPSTAATDGAGVLTFAATGTGNITVSVSSGS